MNIRARIGKLETTIIRYLSVREMSNAQLEARIRLLTGIADDVELTDALLLPLIEATRAELLEGETDKMGVIDGHA
jgi:hypothetical protein